MEEGPGGGGGFGVGVEEDGGTLNFVFASGSTSSVQK